MVTADPTWIWCECEHCGAEFGQPNDPGRKRRYCSGACRTAAYRARKRRQEQTEQERQRRTYEQARDHARGQREDQERRQRQRARQRASQPPPHAGTSRPRVFCGACGGLRATHTYHHDDAHERARRRYEGLRAKAASTSFPHEATACTAKAEQLRDKYGL